MKTCTAVPCLTSVHSIPISQFDSTAYRCTCTCKHGVPRLFVSSFTFNFSGLSIPEQQNTRGSKINLSRSHRDMTCEATSLSTNLGSNTDHPVSCTPKSTPKTLTLLLSHWTSRQRTEIGYVQQQRGLQLDSNWFSRAWNWVTGIQAYIM